ncbi:MAG TPA: hypothetical protein VGN04_08470 [Herbaspirillum sp.]|jgi:hypothetical protein
MNEHSRRKQQLIMQGALCRAQILNAGQVVRHATDIKVLANQAKTAAFCMLKDRLHQRQARVQKGVEKFLPVVLDGVLSASSASTRAIRKPVLYGAMILGAISVLPRFFKGRKSNDNQ